MPYAEAGTVECHGEQQEYADCLVAAGLSGFYTDYHPASRYWPFQVIEAGLLLALAAAALGAGLWGLRRRVPRPDPTRPGERRVRPGVRPRRDRAGGRRTHLITGPVRIRPDPAAPAPDR